MVIELKHRAPRVRFKHPVRVVPLDGAPRIYRTLTANLSRRGMFVRMPEPLPVGTRVALSLEAAGQALPFAEAEIAWSRTAESQWPGRYPGVGVRFTAFLNPRAPELVEYLVKNLDRGRPLKLAPRRRRTRWLALGAGAVLIVLLCSIPAFFMGATSASNAAAASRGERPAEGEEEASEAGDEELPAAPGPVVGDREPRVAPEEPAPEPGASAAADVATPGDEAPSARPPLAASDTQATSPDVGQTLPVLSTGAAPITPDVGPPPPTPPADTPGRRPDMAPAIPQAPDVGASVPTPQSGQPASLEAVADRPLPAIALNRGSTTQAVAQPMRPVAQPKPPGASAPDASPTGAATQAARVSPRSASAGVKSTTPGLNPGRSGTRLALPSGALQAISWHGQATTIEVGLELAPGASLSRAFLLSGPPRLVLDLDGGAPRKSYSLAAGASWIEQVRLGPHGTSTRVVVDLKRAPEAVSHQADRVTLAFPR